MIDYEHEGLFESSSTHKKIVISVDGKTITNNRIYQEGFELLESLCSEESLRFGCCESSQLKVKIRNEFGDLTGKWLSVSMVLNGNNESPFVVGRYKVDSCELSGGKKYANLTAYDSMYDIINANVVTWYDGLVFPITLKDFRDSFFSHLGIEQEETSLIHDDLTIEKTIDADEISGSKVIRAICELNGVFGHINRNGVFVYITLRGGTYAIYPSDYLFPSDDLYPGYTTEPPYTEVSLADSDDSAISSNQSKHYNKYRSCEYKEYETSIIDKIQIRQEEFDIGAIVGDGNNCYVVEDNFLVYGKEPPELETIAENLLDEIYGIGYRPFTATLRGNPCVEVGDMVTIHTRNEDVVSYVLNRTLKGIQSLTDSFSAEGVKEYEEKVNSSNKEIKKLKGKTNKLERTVEETRETITDVEKGLELEIVKNAQEITNTLTNVQKDLTAENEALKSAYSSVVQRIDTFEISFSESQKKTDEQGEEIEDLKKMSYNFGTEDMTIEKSGSEMSTRINEDGMRVYKNNEEVLTANNEGVNAVNLHAKTYLIVGGRSRFENYTNESNQKRTGCFWVG